MKKLLEVQEIPLSLVALITNLALNKKISEIIAGISGGGQGIGIKLLFKKAMRTGNNLVWKLLRNMSRSENTDLKALYIPYVDECIKLMLESSSSKNISTAVLVEIMGILNEFENLDFLNDDIKYKLTDFIDSKLNMTDKPDADDDILLEALRMLNLINRDKEFAVKARFLKKIIMLIKIKQNDDEIVLAGLFVIYQYIVAGSPCDIKLLADLNQDQNLKIRELADICLEEISSRSSNSEFSDKIKLDRFSLWNSAWISRIETSN